MEMLVMCPCPICTTAAIVGLVIFKIAIKKGSR